MILGRFRGESATKVDGSWQSVHQNQLPKAQLLRSEDALEVAERMLPREPWELRSAAVWAPKSYIERIYIRIIYYYYILAINVYIDMNVVLS